MFYIFSLKKMVFSVQNVFSLIDSLQLFLRIGSIVLAASLLHAGPWTSFLSFFQDKESLSRTNKNCIEYLNSLMFSPFSLGQNEEPKINKNKIKLCPKQKSYHVTNENIAPSKITDNVGDERGDAFRGIPKLSCLDLP